MGDILTDPAQYGDTDNTLLLKAATALQSAAAAGASAVLYTSQSLTQAQAGQVYTNLSPAGGAKGIQKFAGDNTGAWGLAWYKGDLTTQLGGIWAEDVNDKVHFDFRQRLSFTPIDGSINGTVIQIGAANGSAGDDIVNVPPQGTASGGATLKNSQNLLLNGETWTAGARASGGVRLRGVPLDVAKNYAFQVAKNDLTGYSAISAVIQTEAGVATICGYGFIGDSDMGIRKDAGGIIIQAQSDTDAQLRLSQGILNGNNGGNGLRFRTGFYDSATDLALQLYYGNAGLGVVGSGEWFGAAGNAKVFSCLTAGLRIEDTMNIILATGTGTKIGTATGQKLSFWNKAPIIQPTTAISAAAFVANSSGIADDTATFGGYTIGKIAAALINVGILT